MKQQLIKSKERVRDHGEVFTPHEIICDMLDLIPVELYEKPDARFLEPACGDGNFLTEILQRKLEIIKKKYKRYQDEYERNAILAIASLYGIDLLDDNVALARQRLFEIVENEYKTLYKTKAKEDFLKSARFVIDLNIVQGNALTLKNKEDKPITFSEWAPVNSVKIKRKDFRFVELADFNPNIPSLFSQKIVNDKGEVEFLPQPVEDYPATHFLNLYKAYDK